MPELLQVKDLNIHFNEGGKSFHAVKNCSFRIGAGKMTAIVGESGSGKSLTSLSLLQLLPDGAKISGQAIFNDGGGELDLYSAKTKINDIRGNDISMIFQEPMTALNPVFTCGNQVAESIMHHQKADRQTAKAKTISLFEQLQLPAPAALFNKYPHQISGGQKQRVMIAMAMANQPKLLIADEPTTALDVRVQKRIMDLLKELQATAGISILLVTHDLAVVADYADDIIVMYKGEIVEQGPEAKILQHPEHPYTKALMLCKPSDGAKGKRLPVLRDFLYPDNKTVASQIIMPEPSAEVVLSVRNVTVEFPTKKTFLGRVKEKYTAVNDVSLDVFKNETVGLVGESGCGKTTLGRTILQLIKPTSGSIFLEGKDLAKLSPADLKVLRKDIQIVFQDPYGSLNPRIRIGDAIMEPLSIHHLANTKKQRRELTADLLEKVGMPADSMIKYPHQFSGGQRQRICIARSLALNPDFLVFDESVSALDVSVQAQVLNLINDLKAEYRFSSLFISHDLDVVHYISDRIMVMQAGKIVEEGPADKVFHHPEHPYTIELLNAIPNRKGRLML